MKKFISAVTSAVIVFAGMSNSIGGVIFAEASNPRIYVDLTYLSPTQVKANVMFQNIPRTCSGGFHINIADGWEVEYDNDYCISTLEYDNPLNLIGCLNSNDTTQAFIGYYGIRNYDVNGCFCSFILNKTSRYTEQNSDVSVYFSSNDNASDCIESFTESGGREKHFLASSSEIIETPVIVRNTEYIVGDATGDNRVDASDASEILRALDLNNNAALYVPRIESCFTTYFPDAKTPYAPDTNKDDFISSSDANRVLRSYGNVMTAGTHLGLIGTVDNYQFYNN